MNVQIDMGQIQRIETEMLHELNQVCSRHKIKYVIHAGSVLGAIRHKGPIPWDGDTDVLVALPDLKFLIECLRKELSDRFCVDFYDVNSSYSPLFPRIGLKNSSSDIVHVDLFPLVGIPDDPKAQIRFSKKSDRINFYYRFRYKKISRMENLPAKRLIGVLLKAAMSLVPKTFFWRIFQKHCGKYPYESANYVMNPCGHRGLKNIFAKEMFDRRIWVDYAHLKLPIPQNYDFYLKQYYKDI